MCTTFVRTETETAYINLAHHKWQHKTTDTEQHIYISSLYHINIYLWNCLCNIVIFYWLEISINVWQVSTLNTATSVSAFFGLIVMFLLTGVPGHCPNIIRLKHISTSFMLCQSDGIQGKWLIKRVLTNSRVIIWTP